MRLGKMVSGIGMGMGILLAACGGPLIGEVAEGTYQVLVPTTEQFATEAADDLPGGFAPLRSSAVNSIEVTVDGDEVTIQLDGDDAVIRQVTERVIVQDSEGSGPLKGEKEVLVLGSEPLILGQLTITDPVIWPGSFDGSPVITLKSFDPEDRGPGVSCGADESCLLLTSGVDPGGGYEDANDPALDQNPIATIEILDDSISFTLDTGAVVTTTRAGETTTRACGLTATALWAVPITVGLDFVDPVLIQASCPTTPGDNYLVIMERNDIPVLAPLGAEFGGEWCQPAPSCLLFVPTG